MFEVYASVKDMQALARDLVQEREKFANLFEQFANALKV